jgi:hypothetical protein
MCPYLWQLVHWRRSFDFRQGSIVIMQFSILLSLKISWALGLFNSFKTSKEVGALSLLVIHIIV